jgi:hypothetical protein
MTDSQGQQEAHRVANSRGQIRAAIVEVQKVERYAKDQARRAQCAVDPDTRLAADARRSRLALMEIEKTVDERYGLDSGPSRVEP